MYYIWKVEVPDDAIVEVLQNKVVCDKFILKNKRHIWSDSDLCNEIVKIDGKALQYVKKQTV